MVNEKRLRKIAEKVNRVAADKKEKETKEKAQAELEKLKAKSDRQIKEWPEYIEKEIEKRAEAGEFNYTFECGDCEDRVLKEMFIHFASLSPFMTTVEKDVMISYDTGTYRTYFVHAIIFKW